MVAGQVQTCDTEVSIDTYSALTLVTDVILKETLLQMLQKNIWSPVLCHEHCLSFRIIKLHVSRSTTVRFPILY
jgi:hypothetical protein